MERRSKQTTTIQKYTPEPKYSMTHSNINNFRINHNQCGKINDKYYLIEINPYTNELLTSSLPIFTNINELDNGIYIYVVLGFDVLEFDDNDVPQIYLLKTLNLYELGTKHQQLIHRISCINNKCKKFKLYYAGELKKTDDTILFNFYSGTFKMETKIKKKHLPNDVEYMSQLLNSELPVEFIQTPLITSDAFTLTEYDLDLYKSMGATIHEFEDKELCRNYSKYFYTNPKQKIPEKIQQKLATESILYGGKTKRRHKKRKYSHKKKIIK
jgi:hypothetical protein